ncbi:hypothetical protein NKH70_22890 [Mesorhizobium sp. M0991]|uniref:hypothetical protein n=1 Tax=Mesorhizobium sp. M0991 TaxID=2957043 RepID=UPI003338AC28
MKRYALFACLSVALMEGASSSTHAASADQSKLILRVGQDIFTSSTSGAFHDKGAACDHVLLMNKALCLQRNFFNTTSVKCECEQESGGTWSCIAITICQD